MVKYFMWIHYERLHNHNKAKHNKTVCIFLGIYCMCYRPLPMQEGLRLYNRWCKLRNSIGQCKKDLTPLLMYWSYIFLAPNHQFIQIWIGETSNMQPHFIIPLSPTECRYQLHGLLKYMWSQQITYCQTSNISHTLVGYKIVDHSDAVGAALVGAAPTTSSF